MKAFYFDTNVLLQLPNWKPTPDFVNLINLSQKIKKPCYIPEVVLKEFINRKVRNAFELANTIERATDNLKKLLVMFVIFVIKNLSATGLELQDPGLMKGTMV